VFCYVNSVFAPGLDEGVGNLWRVSLSLPFPLGPDDEGLFVTARSFFALVMQAGNWD